MYGITVSIEIWVICFLLYLIFMCMHSHVPYLCLHVGVLTSIYISIYLVNTVFCVFFFFAYTIYVKSLKMF